MTMANFESLHVPHKGGGPPWTPWSRRPNALDADARARRDVAGEAAGCASSRHSLPRRSAMLAGLPPVAETVAGYDFNGWAGLVRPRARRGRSLSACMPP